MIPQTNCTLSAVSAPGSTDDWRDEEAVPGPQLFAGAAPAYYQEKRERSSNQATESLLVRRSLIVEDRVPAVAWETEQVVVFTVEGDASSQTGRVQNVERRRFAPAGELQTTRLTLEVL